MAKKGRRSTSEEKLAAVRMMQSGTSPDDVARIFDVSRAIAYRWNQLYEKNGASALEIKKAPGRTPSLTLERRGKIFALIAGSNPVQMQLDFGELVDAQERARDDPPRIPCETVRCSGGQSAARHRAFTAKAAVPMCPFTGSLPRHPDEARCLKFLFRLSMLAARAR